MYLKKIISNKIGIPGNESDSGQLRDGINQWKKYIENKKRLPLPAMPYWRLVSRCNIL